MLQATLQAKRTALLRYDLLKRTLYSSGPGSLQSSDFFDNSSQFKDTSKNPGAQNQQGKITSTYREFSSKKIVSEKKDDRPVRNKPRFDRAFPEEDFELNRGRSNDRFSSASGASHSNGFGRSDRRSSNEFPQRVLSNHNDGRPSYPDSFRPNQPKRTSRDFRGRIDSTPLYEERNMARNSNDGNPSRSLNNNKVPYQGDRPGWYSQGQGGFNPNSSDRFRRSNYEADEDDRLHASVARKHPDSREQRSSGRPNISPRSQYYEDTSADNFLPSSLSSRGPVRSFKDGQERDENHASRRRLVDIDEVDSDSTAYGSNRKNIDPSSSPKSARKSSNRPGKITLKSSEFKKSRIIKGREIGAMVVEHLKKETFISESDTIVSMDELNCPNAQTQQLRPRDSRSSLCGNAIQKLNMLFPMEPTRSNRPLRRLGLSDSICRHLKSWGVVGLSSFQHETVRSIMSGSSVVTCSPYGSGKGLACALACLLSQDMRSLIIYGNICNSFHYYCTMRAMTGDTGIVLNDFTGAGKMVVCSRSDLDVHLKSKGAQESMKSFHRIILPGLNLYKNEVPSWVEMVKKVYYQASEGKKVQMVATMTSIYPDNIETLSLMGFGSDHIILNNSPNNYKHTLPDNVTLQYIRLSEKADLTVFLKKLLASGVVAPSLVLADVPYIEKFMLGVDSSKLTYVSLPAITREARYDAMQGLWSSLKEGKTQYVFECVLGSRSLRLPQINSMICISNYNSFHDRLSAVGIDNHPKTVLSIICSESKLERYLDFQQQIQKTPEEFPLPAELKELTGV